MARPLEFGERACAGPLEVPLLLSANIAMLLSWLGLLSLCSTAALVSLRIPARTQRRPALRSQPLCSSLGPYFTVESGDASALVSAAVLAEDADARWAVATERATSRPIDLSFAMAAATTPTIVIGAPDAAGRLRRLSSGVTMLDALQLGFPKEEAKRAADALGCVVEHLLLEWLAELDAAAGDEVHFEDLVASANMYTADVLERRGFYEIENPDLTALARGEPIVTHSARLPAAILAFTVLAERADHASYAQRARTLLEQLRSQPPPRPQTSLNQEDPPATNPWLNSRIS